MNVGAIQSAVLERPRDTSVKYVGHGQLESSPQSTSVLHVISHELGHVAEFKSEAIRDKAEIRSIDVSIKYEMRDGKLVAVAGETKVTSVKKAEESGKAIQELRNDSDSIESEKNAKGNSEKSGRSEIITDREWDLMSELRQIELELGRLDKNPDSSEESNVKKDEESRKRVELVELKRKLEMELSQEKLKALLKETLDTIQELNRKQIQFANKVYNGEFEAVGNFLQDLA